MREPTRKDDERLLTWLRMRAHRKPVQYIAPAYRVSPSQVDQVTRKVREADLQESGEPAKLVDRAYWPKRNRR
jgi:hypothetical protein